MKSCPTCQTSYPTKYSVCPQDGTPLVELTTWPDGTVIRGKYRILSKLGQGGMGAVYKALHLAFDELRALKVISTEFAGDDLFVKRFKHEAFITRKLQHPNAVRVDDIDEAEDGRPFIVMEFIEGQSLKQLIQDHGPLPVPRACSIARQVCAALDAAHRLGMVHRDIKPDNIVLVDRLEGEQAKVLDFGIAKVKEARLGQKAGLTLSGTGLVIGTPQYMSPEQAKGLRGDDLDGRSDLYSLGIVMYQMLVGDLPFKADTTMEMLLAHMHKRPRSIKTLRPDLPIPDSIVAVVMKTLEKNRDLRPLSAQALSDEIDHAEKASASAGAPRTLNETLRITPGVQVPAAAHRAPARAPAASRKAGAPAEAVPRDPAVPAKPAPVTVPMPGAPAASEPRWGLWVAMLILVAGLGGGAWFFAAHRPKAASEAPLHVPQPAITPAVAPAAPAGSRSTGAGQNTAQGAASAPTPRGRQTKTGAVANRQQSSPPGSSRTSRDASKSKPSNQYQKVSAAVTLGDFYLSRGDYDKAIRAYQEGLSADSSDATLQSKLTRAKNAKAAEKRVLP